MSYSGGWGLPTDKQAETGVGVAGAWRAVFGKGIAAQSQTWEPALGGLSAALGAGLFPF